MSRSIFLLGAGASVEANLPTASELTACALSHFDAQSNAKRSLAARFDSDMGRHLRAVIGPMQAFEALHGDGTLGLPNIEAVVSAVELLSSPSSVELTPFVQLWDPAVHAIQGRYSRVSTYGMLADTSSQEHLSLFDKAEGGSRGEYFGRLHDALLTFMKSALALPAGQELQYLQPLVQLRDADRTGPMIATLNYDLTLERAAEQIGVPWSHGLSTWLRSGRPEWPNGHLRIVKLHGSLDWAEEFVPAAEGRLGKWSWAAGDANDIHTPPFIVFGQREKLRPNGPFLALRAAFEAELYESKQLVVIGYSFGDEHMNSIIERWIDANVEHRLIVVDPHWAATQLRSPFAAALEKLRAGVAAESAGRIVVMHIPAGAAIHRISTPTAQAVGPSTNADQ